DQTGESTIVLPMCPVCGEAGKPIPRAVSQRMAKEPTSRISSSSGSSITGEPEAPADPFSPPQLADYELVDEIGRGGMGIVYRANDMKRGGQVAVKCLPRIDPNKLLRFKQEFRSVVDLSHPNLASVYELLNIGGRWCLVMELVTGVPFVDYFH